MEKTDATREFLGACHEAKQMVDLMPELPEGMKPSHIHIIDIIYRLQQANDIVRISDIGTELHITNPSITRVVNELVDFGAVEKVQNQTDKRVYTVSLTALGIEYYRKYLQEYHARMAERFTGISVEDMETAANVIHEAYRIMSDGKMKI